MKNSCFQKHQKYQYKPTHSRWHASQNSLIHNGRLRIIWDHSKYGKSLPSCDEYYTSLLEVFENELEIIFPKIIPDPEKFETVIRYMIPAAFVIFMESYFKYPIIHKALYDIKINLSNLEIY